MSNFDFLEADSSYASFANIGNKTCTKALMQEYFG